MLYEVLSIQNETKKKKVQNISKKKYKLIKKDVLLYNNKKKEIQTLSLA